MPAPTFSPANSIVEFLFAIFVLMFTKLFKVPAIAFNSFTELPPPVDSTTTGFDFDLLEAFAASAIPGAATNWSLQSCQDLKLTLMLQL